MFNITNYQGYANQTHNEIQSHTCENAYYKKDNIITNVGKKVDKRNSLCTTDGNEIGAATMEKMMEFLQKLKNRTTMQTSNFISGYLCEENEETLIGKHMHPYARYSIIHNSQDIKV